MKKMLALILALTLLLSGCASQTENRETTGSTQATQSTWNSQGSTPQDTEPAEDRQVAPVLGSVELRPTGPGAMDLVYYGQNLLKFEELDKDPNYSTSREFSGDASGYQLLQAYVQLLCDKYQFALAGEPYYNEMDIIFFDFVLVYTGTGELQGSGTHGNFSKLHGDLSIWGSISKNKLTGYITYDSSLEMVDQGYRYGSHTGGNTYVGDSFGAGLIERADGSFSTSDGRFSVTLGQAEVIADGQHTQLSASYEMNLDDNQQSIRLESDQKVAQLHMYFPTAKSLVTGQRFTEPYFIQEADYVLKTQGLYSKVPSYTWETMFACLHNGQYTVPVRGMAGEMTRLNVRILYADSSRNILVLYFAARFRTAPQQIEGLVAVRTGDVVENQPDEEFTVSVGKSLEIQGPKEFGTGYDLWKWEFLEGSDISELQNTTSRTCTLIAQRTGDVRIRVTYEYSVEETDVLTGNPRQVQKTKTREYVIHIE